MLGKIEQVRDSKSGKTLSVLIGGQWYSTKAWEFREMVGQTIDFESSTSEFQGSVMHWLNDYSVVAQAPQTADAAMNAAMATQPPPMPPTPPVEAYQPAPQTAAAPQPPQATHTVAAPNKDAVIGGNGFV